MLENKVEQDRLQTIFRYLIVSCIYNDSKKKM